MNCIALVFSRDRALQLDGVLRTFLLHCEDAKEMQIRVLYKTTSSLHSRVYEQLVAEYRQHSSIQFIPEMDFRTDVIKLVAPFDHVLFLVDDNIFVRDFCLSNILSGLDDHPEAIGCSLRLGENTTYCYPLHTRQLVPEFIPLGRGLLKFDWTEAEYDFAYPLEVSSSVYPVKTFLPLLTQLPYQNPNTLESLMDASKGSFRQSKPWLLCYEQSLTFCAPFNKVQTVAPNNRSTTCAEYTAENLAGRFEEGFRMEVAAYRSFVPNSCHQEVPLKLSRIAGRRPDGKPLVSIVIPCYEQANFLPEAVESIVAQTFEDWELIIVNDGSTDDTSGVAGRLIEKYSTKNICLLEKENGGLADARNTGIAAARGKYILPLDADDKISADYLAEAVAILEDRPEYAIVYVDEQNFGNASHIHRKGLVSLENQLRSNIHDYCSLFRKELWERIGGYSPAMFLGGEDWNFWITAAKMGLQSYHLAKPYFWYRNRVNSMVAETLAKLDEVKAHIVLHHPELFNQEAHAQAEKILAHMSESSRNKLEVTLQKHPQNPILKKIHDFMIKGDTQMPPLVSVILPTFNRPDTLAEAIQSIFDQSFQNFEILLINDGGADVRSFIHPFKSQEKMIYLQHEKNRGLAACRNTGIRAARGRYIAYLDDDDVYYPDHLKTLVNFLESGRYPVAYTDARRAHQILKDGKYIVAKKDVQYAFDFDYEEILVGNYVPVICIMHEKRCLEEVGLFDETLSTHEDWDLWIRMSRKFQFHHITKLTCEYASRQDGTTMSSGKKAEIMRNTKFIHGKYQDFIKDRPDIREKQKRFLEALEKELFGSTDSSPVTGRGNLMRDAGPKGEKKSINGGVPFDLYQELGECYAHVGRNEEAIRHFEEALTFDPWNERPYIGLGTVALQGGDSLRAKEYFLQAMQLNPRSDKALSGLGISLSTHGSSAEGFVRFQEALDLNPDNMPALMGVLQSADHLNQLPIAEAYLKKYLERHVADLQVLYCLAGVYFKLGKYGEAREAVSKILIFEPANQDAVLLQRQIEEKEKGKGSRSSS